MGKDNLHPRRAARQCVLEALFAYQFSKNDTVDQLVSENPQLKSNNDFIYSLYDGVLEHTKLTEGIIKSHLENWEIDRIAQIDKILLKMGICEIYFIYDIPPKVTISEMVEIANALRKLSEIDKRQKSTYSKDETELIQFIGNIIG